MIENMKGLALLALFASGCSAVGARSPKTAREPAGCTADIGYPLLDTLATGALIGLGLAVIIPGIGEPGPAQKFEIQNTVGGVSIAMGTPFLISAIYGYVVTARCRQAHRGAASTP